MVIPTAATVHIDAAVVKPWTPFSPEAIIVPAPKNPTPVIIAAATLAGSDKKNSIETTVAKVAPKQTSICVLKPAGLCFFLFLSLSRPQ